MSDSIPHNISDTDQYDFTQTDNQSNSRCLYPSIVNKSSIHTYTQSNNNLIQLPHLPTNTQKLCLNNNSISTFPTNLINLKQVNLNRNMIDKIPLEINQISTLVIIRMNYNCITTLPFLKYVRHLQLYHNPIKVITTKLHETHLEYFVFDWVPFLMHPSKTKHQNESFHRICTLLNKLELDQFQQFIEFDRLFQQNLKLCNYPINYFLHKAIYRQSQFFIDYLISYQNHLNFNAMMYFQRYILQQVLQQDFKPALNLFTLKKSNLHQKQVCIINIILACKFNNLNLFNFFINGVSKRSLLIDQQSNIIEHILRNFNQNKGSLEMLKKIMKYAGFNKQHKKKFQLPQDYNSIEGQAIAEGLIAILTDKQLRNIFQWEIQNSSDNQQPLLHFAVQTKQPELVKILLKYGFSSNITNSLGKRARSIRGSIVSRKIIWKHDKYKLKIKLSNKHIQEFQQIQSHHKKQTEQKQKKWFQYIFDQQLPVTPKKKPQKQTAQINNLISKQIDRMQGNASNSYRKHKNTQQKILHIGSHKKSVSSVLNDLFVPQNDQCGLLLEYWMYYRQNTQQQIDKKIQKIRQDNQRLNPLIEYEYYQKSLFNKTPHIYEQPKKSSIFPRLSFCGDIKDLEQQQKKEYIVTVDNHRFIGGDIDVDRRIELFDIQN